MRPSLISLRSYGRSRESMATLRTLLLSLLLPALTLPEGVTVCLRRLAGEAPTPACCARCAVRAPRDAHAPRLAPDACVSCCLAVPEGERSLDPVAGKRRAETLEPILHLAPAATASVPFALAPPRGPSAWSHHDPPRSSAVPIPLPLRL